MHSFEFSNLNKDLRQHQQQQQPKSHKTCISLIILNIYKVCVCVFYKMQSQTKSIAYGTKNYDHVLHAYIYAYKAVKCMAVVIVGVFLFGRVCCIYFFFFFIDMSCIGEEITTDRQAYLKFDSTEFDGSLHLYLCIGIQFVE